MTDASTTAKDIVKFSKWEKSPLSPNHYDDKFTIDNVDFKSLGMYLAYKRAELFEDDEMMRQIIRHYSTCYDRAFVRNYDHELWCSKLPKFLAEGNMAKFSQNPSLAAYLIKTYPNPIYYCEPSDPEMSIGLWVGSKYVGDLQKHRGKNWLGVTLEACRRKLMEQRKISVVDKQDAARSEIEFVLDLLHKDS